LLRRSADPLASNAAHPVCRRGCIEAFVTKVTVTAGRLTLDSEIVKEFKQS
jgi:hypothetical protein